MSTSYYTILEINSIIQDRTRIVKAHLSARKARTNRKAYIGYSRPGALGIDEGIRDHEELYDRMLDDVFKGLRGACLPDAIRAFILLDTMGLPRGYP